MIHRRHPIRNFDAPAQVERLFIVTVVTILSVRLLLKATGYPQISPGRLHIAHVLFGGLLMAISILMLLMVLGRRAQLWGAIIGGVGFGLFIDEVGKFLTRDNDYFFQPAVSVMYVTLVALFLSVRTIWQAGPPHPDEYLANALRELQESAKRSLDEYERRRILAYLAKSDPGHPLVPALRSALEHAVARVHRESWTRRFEIAIRRKYARLVEHPWFAPATIAVFAARAALGARYILLPLVTKNGPLTFANLAELASYALSTVFAVIGSAALYRSKLKAFVMFEGSVLVSLLVGEVFSFYREQFAATVWLAIDLVCLIAVRFVVRHEQRR